MFFDKDLLEVDFPCDLVMDWLLNFDLLFILFWDASETIIVFFTSLTIFLLYSSFSSFFLAVSTPISAS